MPCPALLLILACFCACATCFDVRCGRIPNALNAAGLALGIVSRFVFGGAAPLRSGLAGAALGAAMLLPPFLLHMVGGGDVKFLAAAGSITGWQLLLPSFLAGAAAGGAAGLALILRGDRGLERLRLRILLLQSPRPGGAGTRAPRVGSGLEDFAMPYAVPLSLGLVAVSALRCVL